MIKEQQFLIRYMSIKASELEFFRHDATYLLLLSNIKGALETFIFVTDSFFPHQNAKFAGKTVLVVSSFLFYTIEIYACDAFRDTVKYFVLTFFSKLLLRGAILPWRLP